MLDGLSIPGYAIFAAVGFFCGWCFREIGILKVILMIAVVPSLFQFVIVIDDIWWVTLPFLLGCVLGFWGLRQAKYKLLGSYDHIRRLFGRIR